MTPKMSADDLTREQANSVLRFLLHRMGSDTRRQLMAEMPVAYANLYPTMTAAVIVDEVATAIRTTRELRLIDPTVTA